MKTPLLFSLLLALPAFAQSVWTQRTTPTGTAEGTPAGKPGLYLVPTRQTNTDGTLQRYFRSLNGTSWTSTYLPFSSFQHLPLTYANGRFAGFDSSVLPPRLWTTTDGLTYTATTSVTGGSLSDFYPAGIAFGNGVWLMTGAAGTVLRSTDNAATWRVRTTPADSLDTIAFGSGKFLAAAQNGSASLLSTDGTTWTIGPEIPGPTHIYAGGKFLTETHFSIDGLEWSPLPEPELPPESFYVPALIAGSNGTALTWSHDTQPAFSYYDGTWHGPYPSGVLSGIRNVALCGDLWIAVTESGRVITSPTPALPAPVAPALNIAPALRLTWQSQTGRSYIIQRSLNNAAWTDYTGTMLGTGAVMEWLAPASASREFFRVQVR